MYNVDKSSPSNADCNVNNGIKLGFSTTLMFASSRPSERYPWMRCLLNLEHESKRDKYYGMQRQLSNSEQIMLFIMYAFL